MKEVYGVYVRTDAQGRVTAINSDAFLRDTTGWVKIDEGSGTRYMHAQGNYLPDMIVDVRGVFRYKLEGGALVERTAEEMDADAAQIVVPPTQAKRLAQLEADAELLLEATGNQEYRLCLMELGVSDSDL